MKPDPKTVMNAMQKLQDTNQFESLPPKPPMAAPAEVESYTDFLMAIEPFARRLMARTDIISMLQSKPVTEMVVWARNLSKSSKMMLTQTSDQKDATSHAGENLFAKVILAANAYNTLYGKWPNPARPITMKGQVLVEAANPDQWKTVQKWVEAVLVYSGLKK